MRIWTVAVTCCTTMAMFAGGLSAETWRVVSGDELAERAAGNMPRVHAIRLQAVQLDPASLEMILDRAPVEGDERAASRTDVLLVPTPDGGFERFSVVESPVMEPELELWLSQHGYPMKTFRGESLDRPATTARFDWGGPDGFHAIVISPDETTYVDPYFEGNRELHVAYRKSDNRALGPMRCEVPDFDGPLLPLDGSGAAKAGSSTNGNLRTYRAAIAATGDYTDNLAGGSTATAQANVVTIVNRINATYEREVSVRLILVGNNSSIIYDDADTDPYTQTSASTMLGENTTNLNAVIGSGDYDIGHVIYNGGSGIATLSGPCGSNKARGVSGLWQATGDSVVVDMIGHEMGHQFGAHHTFNSPLGYCSGNRTAATAYEPGSGTTIMSYSGSCDADNVQTDSDDYFHGISLDEMLNFVAGGGSCSANVSAGNPNAPSVSATGGFTIPVGTPFELAVDSASDADGDTLTFSWEQFDLGAAATVASGDNGASPIVRSLPPSTSSTRLVTGDLFGETLPSSNRNLSFRVTARDNNSGGGRVGEASIVLTSTTAAGPFVLTSPNGGESFSAGSTQTVSWNVAGTNAGAVNSPNVDILLSTDGGATYGTVLASATPNDGSHGVTLPLISSSNARIMVRGSSNIFFDESDADFSINAYLACVNPDLTIPQWTPTSADIVVSGQPDLITDLDASVEVTYPVVGALRVTLQHVDTGTSAMLIDRPGLPEVHPDYGCQTANIDAILDDEAAAAAHDACSASPPALGGRLFPKNPLSAFDGEALNGTWRMTVVEPFYSWGGTKIFNGFCIQAPLPIEAPDIIFSDGFEDGNTSQWSSTVP